MVSRIAGQNALQLRMLRGAGDGTLVYKDSRGGFPYTGFPTRPQTADLSADRIPDLILETHTVIVLRGHGDMTFGRAQVIISGALQTGHVNAWSALLGLVLAHLNGDGHLDLALCREPDNIRRTYLGCTGDAF